MDIVNFNKKINKITVLTDSVEDGIFSALERDLLLTYIRDLYDIALGDNPVAIKKNEKHTYTPVEEKVVVKQEIPVNIPSVKAVPEQISASTEVAVVEPVLQTPSIPPTIQKKEEKESVKVLELTPAAVETTEKTVKAIPLVEKVKVATPARNLADSELLNELFSEDKVNDLSDKLGLTPVQDLTKSMGINERIFTQQELFNNNAQQFNDVLNLLNGFKSFEDAKQYLITTVIPEYGWMQDNKIKKATTFIKLVKRKYL